MIPRPGGDGTDNRASTGVNIDTLDDDALLSSATTAIKRLGQRCKSPREFCRLVQGLAPTVELWRKAVPDRSRVSPLLVAMTSVTGTVTRFMHIWPYTSLDERMRLRAKAVDDGVWPPPGGPGYLASQQSDIYLPATFSPLH